MVQGNRPLREVAAGEVERAVARSVGRRAYPPLMLKGVIQEAVRVGGSWRLGVQMTRIWYAKGLCPSPSTRVTVLYGAGWRAAGIDFYSF